MLEENESKPLLASPSLSPETTEKSPAVPQASAEFRTVPKDAEAFGTVSQVPERKENHTLTVREVARMFETAGVARTERSIINWCQPNRQGVARLDSYFDPNERKYFITPHSVDSAIQEEIQRADKSGEAPASEAFRPTVEPVKHPSAKTTTNNFSSQRIRELERENFDLKVTNRAREMVIERIQKERDDIVDKMLAASRTVGQLETRLTQLIGPKM